MYHSAATLTGPSLPPLGDEAISQLMVRSIAQLDGAFADGDTTLAVIPVKPELVAGQYPELDRVCVGRSLMDALPQGPARASAKDRRQNVESEHLMDTPAS